MMGLGSLNFTFFVACATTTESVIANDDYLNNSLSHNELLADLPEGEDIDKYLSTLEAIMHFVDKHKLYVDMNFSFGLFLIGVHLRKAVIMKADSIPLDILARLTLVLNINKETMNYFQFMVGNMTLAPKANIANLFVEHEAMWANHLQEFRIDLLMKTQRYSKEKLIEIYSELPKYVQDLNNLVKCKPNPKRSNKCLIELSESPVTVPNFWLSLFSCHISRSCKDMPYSGNDFGYGITHRVLYFIMARYGRRCVVRSDSEDKDAIEKMCAKIYNEVEYLWHHNFENVDIVLEQIVVCTLEGHVQFLRRSWIQELINVQTELGCFPMTKEKGRLAVIEDKEPIWEISRLDQDIMGRVCNTHTTGLAAAMVSTAIRYILEKYY